MRVTERQLRSFLVIAQAQTLAGAGSTLGVTQPALSKQIKNLEEALGVPLFIRHGRGMSLTAAGIDLQVRLIAAYDQVDAAVESVVESGNLDRGALTIASGSTTGTYLVPVVVAELVTRFPKTRITVLTANAAEVLGYVERGIADMGVIYDISVDTEKFEVTRLHAERLCAYRHVDQSGPSRYQLFELPGLPLLLPLKHLALRRILELECKRSLHTVVECGSLEAAMHLASLRVGIAVLPDALPDALVSGLSLRKIPIVGGNLSRRIAVARRLNSRTSPLANAGLECLQKVSAAWR